MKTKEIDPKNVPAKSQQGRPTVLAKQKQLLLDGKCIEFEFEDTAEDRHVLTQVYSALLHMRKQKPDLVVRRKGLKVYAFTQSKN